MKSSYELAMERMGGGDKPLNEKQKAKIADIDSKYKAKIAERKIFLEKKLYRYGEFLKTKLNYCMETF